MSVVVVAAAIVRDGRVLAAQRDYPAELAGKWELPGGKVDATDASDVDALVRECQEELGVTIDVLHRVGPDLGVEFALRVWWARIASGELNANEHRDLRWLAADEVGDVDWLPTNRPLVALLRAGLVDWPG